MRTNAQEVTFLALHCYDGNVKHNNEVMSWKGKRVVYAGTWMRASDIVSTFDVASSSTRTLAARSRARAMHSSCLCPVLRFPPPSVMSASKPPCTPFCNG